MGVLPDMNNGAVHDLLYGAAHIYNGAVHDLYGAPHILNGAVHVMNSAPHEVNGVA